MITKASIQNLIVKGQLDKALENLAIALPDDLKNDVVLLQARLKSFTRSEIMGLLGFSEANISRNQITNSILNLADELDDNSSNSSDDTSSPNIQQTHHGSGDNIAGDKIGKQININKGNYIENQTIVGEPDSSNNKNTKTILFTAASPSDEARLQTDLEHRTIQEEMQKGTHRDNFSFLPIQSAVRIQELMRSFKAKPTIVHFSGHGAHRGILISSNNNNKGVLLNDGATKRLFKPIKDSTELVILNSCYSSHQAKFISQYGIIVIGHNLPIEDDAAIAFSMGFYLGLSTGSSYEEAFNDGVTAVMTKDSEYVDIVAVWKDGEKLDW